jgi:hypothetical protein
MDDGSTLGSTYATVESHEVLPQLPGFRTNQHKSGNKKQSLKYIEGQRYLLEAGGGASSAKLSSSNSATSLTLSRGRPGEPAPTKPAFRFVLNSAQVLCFFGYFKEAVHESYLENHRIRKVEMFYYLEDDAMQIVERKMENSGVPQGNFMKRHRVPKDDDPSEPDAFYTLDDLTLGATISIYGRTFHIIDCNKSTRDYLASVGKDVGPSVGWPDDKYEKDRATMMSRETGQDPNVKHNVRKNPMKLFAEASLGNTVDNSGREGFLKYDRKVLRFSGVWDDRTNLYGDLQRFKVHYFLTDNTVEVLAVYNQNSGRDPFPKLLSRRKLPKDTNDDEAGFWHWTDLCVGGVMSVFSRNMLLTDADDQTRDFYAGNGTPMMPSIEHDVGDDEEPKFERVLPPYTGFGSEEDSLTSCVGSLVQTAPKKQLGEGTTMRYLAKLDDASPEDEDRTFVVQYYTVDSTVMIREPPRRNSGAVGGKFLARMQLKDDTGAVISKSEFFVGARLALAGHAFLVIDTDDATLKCMEGDTESFPYSCYASVVNAVAGKIDTDGGLPASGECSADALAKALEPLGLPKQAAITIVRKLGEGGKTCPVEVLAKALS